MTLYYEDEYVQLHHGDCRAVRGWTRADVLVTDPPYGMSFQSNMRKRAKLDRIEGDNDTAIRDAVVDLWGDTKPALLFGRWSVPAPVGERQRLIWHKASTPGMGDLSIPWGPAHEEIHLLGRGWDVAATGEKRSGSVITTRGGRGGAAGEENVTGHPTPKPVALMEALVSRTPSGVIADPFAGSGATLIAARNLGRKVIGVEIEEKYCELIVKRLSQQAFDFSSLDDGAA
jgi:site-specific DNA-methyltransferase (adenine-specific)